jgi:ferritin-like metal-binding protein YciE
MHHPNTTRTCISLTYFLVFRKNFQKICSGKSATKDKAQLPIPSPPKSLAKIVGKMTSAELELKAAKEDAIIENAEIIIYDMLTHLAEKTNAAHAIPVLTQSLSEETSMADWNTPDMVIQLWPEIEASVGASEEEQ